MPKNLRRNLLALRSARKSGFLDIHEDLLILYSRQHPGDFEEKEIRIAMDHIAVEAR